MKSLIDFKVPRPTPTFNHPYADGLEWAVIEYARHPNIMEHLLTMSSVRSVTEAFYFVLVGKKELEPIESLEKGEKQQIWERTKGLSMRERKAAARAIYLIEKIKQ